MVTSTPPTPYYAVIFTSILQDNHDGYTEMTNRIHELVQAVDGYLGMDSARSDIGITVSYWKDLESIEKWRKNSAHAMAKEIGKRNFYKNYRTRIVKVEQEY